ncbi:MAG: Ni/Fe-hydrogenase cytochrome b subunit [Deltaproteobacteria bacterium]|nr:Ni/Fe-hydrogenase cytochrome b subunit [Deltaproteobacteria bacterium]
MFGTFAEEKKKSLGDIIRFIIRELKPRGNIFTPFNIISAPIILLGAFLIFLRLYYGLGSVTNLSQDYPWGIWIAFDVMCGVAFAGGAYVLCFVVYILNAEKYHTVIRATVLNGLLAYMFYAGAIFLDLGRWWNIVNPIIGREFGVNSVLFLVAWHFLLYMLAELIEFSPAIAEWLEAKKLRKILSSMTLGAVIFGICLSTLHQSGLGALVMMAKPNIHPLWYTEFIPVLFFVSSIFAGLSMVIFEGTISHRVFHHVMDDEHRRLHDPIVFSLAKAAGVVMFGYFFLKVLVFIHGKQFGYLTTPMGYLFLVETVGLVLLPCYLYLRGAKLMSKKTVLIAAFMTMLGVILNRFNYVFIAYKWYLPLSERYIPTWMEVVITLAIVFAEIWVFRFCVNRMPVLRSAPDWAVAQDNEKKKEKRRIERVIPLTREVAL